jgi:hypothetical protein
MEAYLPTSVWVACTLADWCTKIVGHDLARGTPITGPELEIFTGVSTPDPLWYKLFQFSLLLITC